MSHDRIITDYYSFTYKNNRKVRNLKFETMRFWIISFLGVMQVLITACNTKTPEFSLSYSQECVNNYKLVIHVFNDKRYVLEEYNYFFDNMEKKREPIIKQGVLDNRTFREISALMRQSDIVGLPDYYEGRQNADAGNFLYQLTYKTGGTEKYIFLREVNRDQLPSPFFRLLHYLTALSARLN